MNRMLQTGLCANSDCLTVQARIRCRNLLRALGELQREGRTVDQAAMMAPKAMFSDFDEHGYAGVLESIETIPADSEKPST
jgi:hypothetical protein